VRRLRLAVTWTGDTPVARSATTRCRIRPIIHCTLVLTPMLSLLACARVPTDPEARAEYERNNDPAEPTNRVIFAGNLFLDRHLLKPIARGYEDLPGGVRNSFHNFVGNLGQPEVAVNDVLQGNISRAWNTTQRFAINTTIGGAGLFDAGTVRLIKPISGKHWVYGASGPVRRFNCRYSGRRMRATAWARLSASWPTR